MAYREDCTEYRDISLIRRRLPLGPYSRLMPRALWEVLGGHKALGGWALSHERGTPVYAMRGSFVVRYVACLIAIFYFNSQNS